jgi:hypothetical protein
MTKPRRSPHSIIPLLQSKTDGETEYEIDTTDCDDNSHKDTTSSSTTTSPPNHDGHNRQFNPSWLSLSDCLAIVLASQMIGLLDIVNSTEFVQAGGWFQPMPAVPTTFALLVKRMVNLAALRIVSLTLVETLLSQKIQQQDVTTTWIQPSDWISFAAFCGLRLIGGCAVYLMSDESHDIALMHVFEYQNYDWILISLRDSYFVGLFTLTLRYLFRQDLS